MPVAWRIVGENVYCGAEERVVGRINIWRMKQGIVGGIGNCGKAMELWERIENSGLAHRLVGDETVRGKRGL